MLARAPVAEPRGHPGRRPAGAAAQPGYGKNTKARFADSDGHDDVGDRHG